MLRTKNNFLPFLCLGRLLEENKVSQNNNNQNKCSGNLSNISKSQKIVHAILSSNLTLISKNNIPSPISFVKATNVSAWERSAKFGVTNAKPNHAAERLIDKPDKAVNHDLEYFLIKSV